jgi:hypothetical protein
MAWPTLFSSDGIGIARMMRTWMTDLACIQRAQWPPAHVMFPPLQSNEASILNMCPFHTFEMHCRLWCQPTSVYMHVHHCLRTDLSSYDTFESILEPLDCILVGHFVLLADLRLASPSPRNTCSWSSPGGLVNVSVIY